MAVLLKMQLMILPYTMRKGLMMTAGQRRDKVRTATRDRPWLMKLTTMVSVWHMFYFYDGRLQTFCRSYDKITIMVIQSFHVDEEGPTHAGFVCESF